MAILIFVARPLDYLSQQTTYLTVQAVHTKFVCLLRTTYYDSLIHNINKIEAQ